MLQPVDKPYSPPSSEGGGTRFARAGGRENFDKSSFLTTPPSRYARQPLTAAVPSVALRHLPTPWGVTPDKGSQTSLFDTLKHRTKPMLFSFFDFTNPIPSGVCAFPAI